MLSFASEAARRLSCLGMGVGVPNALPTVLQSMLGQFRPALKQSPVNAINKIGFLSWRLFTTASFFGEVRPIRKPDANLICKPVLYKPDANLICKPHPKLLNFGYSQGCEGLRERRKLLYLLGSISRQILKNGYNAQTSFAALNLQEVCCGFRKVLPLCFAQPAVKTGFSNPVSYCWVDNCVRSSMMLVLDMKWFT